MQAFIVVIVVVVVVVAAAAADAVVVVVVVFDSRFNPLHALRMPCDVRARQNAVRLAYGMLCNLFFQLQLLGNSYV